MEQKITKSTFNDHFGAKASAYHQYRPGYPRQLFDSLAAASQSHRLAWDCATGTGQAALPLADYYESVLATDASGKQLRGAAAGDSVYFVQAQAETPCVKPASVDLIVVAQALHWFHLPSFFAIAQSVLAPGGVFAAWTYNLMTVDEKLDPILHDFYHNTVGAYWPAQRRLVERGYEDVTVPFTHLELGEFAMRARWTLDQLCGYLSTWSAVQRYIADRKEDPLPALRAQLLQVWDDDQAVKEVSWPLSIRAGTH